MSDHQPDVQRDPPQDSRAKSGPPGSDPLALLDECLASFPDQDPRQKILYKLRHLLIQQGTLHQQRETEFKKLSDVVGKLTAPANRIGTLLEIPADGLARIVVGGAEYYTNSTRG